MAMRRNTPQTLGLLGKRRPVATTRQTKTAVAMRILVATRTSTAIAVTAIFVKAKELPHMIVSAISVN
jgi:hypothetical protein